MLEGSWGPIMWIEDHYHPLVGVLHFISRLEKKKKKNTLWQAYHCLPASEYVCVWESVWAQLPLTLPASLSGRPESLSEDLPLVRLSREWQEVASNRASYGLSSSGPGASPEINSLTFSRSPMKCKLSKHTDWFLSCTNYTKPPKYNWTDLWFLFKLWNFANIW